MVDNKLHDSEKPIGDRSKAVLLEDEGDEMDGISSATQWGFETSEKLDVAPPGVSAKEHSRRQGSQGA